MQASLLSSSPSLPNSSTVRIVHLFRGSKGFGFSLRNDSPCEFDGIMSCSSAANAGLKRGDVLIGVNGQDVSTWRHEEVAQLVWCLESAVTLKVMSQGLPHFEEDTESVAPPVPFRRRRAPNVTSSGQKLAKDCPHRPPRAPSVSDPSVRSSSGSGSSVNDTGSVTYRIPSRVLRNVDDSQRDLRSSAVARQRRSAPLAAGYAEELPDTHYNSYSSPYHSLRQSMNYESPSEGSIGPEDIYEIRQNSETLQKQLIGQAFIGYAGTVQFTNNGQSRLTSIASSIARFKSASRSCYPVLFTMEAIKICVLPVNSGKVANYPVTAVAHVGLFAEDSRCFCLVIRGGLVNSFSCHVFRVDPSRAPHSVHADQASILGLQCHRLQSGDECWEFPRTASSLVQCISRVCGEGLLPLDEVVSMTGIDLGQRVEDGKTHLENGAVIAPQHDLTARSSGRQSSVSSHSNSVSSSVSRRSRNEGVPPIPLHANGKAVVYRTRQGSNSTSSRSGGSSSVERVPEPPKRTLSAQWKPLEELTPTLPRHPEPSTSQCAPGNGDSDVVFKVPLPPPAIMISSEKADDETSKNSQNGNFFQRMTRVRTSWRKKVNSLSISHESLAFSSLDTDDTHTLHNESSNLLNLSLAHSEKSVYDAVKMEEGVTRGRVAKWATGFDHLLADQVGVATFKEFLKCEYSSENIIFWEAVEMFHKIDDQEELRSQAQEIFHLYLNPNGACAVNVDSFAINDAAVRLGDPTPTMFNHAQRQVYHLMKSDSFARFIKSPMYCNSLMSDMQSQPLPFENGKDLSKGRNEKTLKASKSVSSLRSNQSGGKKRRSLIPWFRKSKKGDTDNADGVSIGSESVDCQTHRPELRLFLPDGSSTLVPTETGSLLECLSALCVRRKLDLASLSVRYCGTEKSVDLSTNLCQLEGKELMVEKRVLFRVTVTSTNRWFGVKCKTNRTLRQSLKEVASRVGVPVDDCLIYRENSKERIPMSMSVNGLDRNKLVMYTKEDMIGIENRTPKKERDIPDQLKNDTWQSILDGSHSLMASFDEHDVFDSRFSTTKKRSKSPGRVGLSISTSSHSLFKRPVSVREVKAANPRLHQRKNSAGTIACFNDPKDHQFLDLLSRVQGARLDDQRGINLSSLELPDFLKPGMSPLRIGHTSSPNMSFRRSLSQPYDESAGKVLAAPSSGEEGGIDGTSTPTRCNDDVQDARLLLTSPGHVSAPVSPVKPLRLDWGDTTYGGSEMSLNNPSEETSSVSTPSPSTHILMLPPDCTDEQGHILMLPPDCTDEQGHILVLPPDCTDEQGDDPPAFTLAMARAGVSCSTDSDEEVITFV